ncbi:MAG: hypothetical protein JWQ07_3825 [Ramlibacter sp.]|nr:hypothetical protein [Ramlibacter sp.]
MNKLLALAGIVAMLAACAAPPRAAVATAEQPDDGEVIAASLGFHGPAVRAAKNSD